MEGEAGAAKTSVRPFFGQVDSVFFLGGPAKVSTLLLRHNKVYGLADGNLFLNFTEKEHHAHRPPNERAGPNCADLLSEALAKRVQSSPVVIRGLLLVSLAEAISDLKFCA